VRGLRAGHLGDHEDGEDEAVAHVGGAVHLARAPLEGGRPQEDEDVEGCLVEGVD